jgi:hypothetical protein
MLRNMKRNKYRFNKKVFIRNMLKLLLSVLLLLSFIGNYDYIFNHLYASSIYESDTGKGYEIITYNQFIDEFYSREWSLYDFGICGGNISAVFPSMILFDDRAMVMSPRDYKKFKDFYKWYTTHYDYLKSNLYSRK